MKRKTIIISIIVILILLFTPFVKIPEYKELNSIMIVDSIGVECKKKTYTLYLKEIIPKKDDNGISYEYKIYISNDNESLKDSLNEIVDKSTKKIFLKDTRYLITNCEKSEKIIKFFHINPKTIKHTTKDIKKELKNH